MKNQQQQASSETPAADFEPWAWREFGGQMMIVTKHGGSKVVLSIQRLGRTETLATRDPETGIMRPVRPDDTIAKLIISAPQMANEMAALKRERDGLKLQIETMTRIAATREKQFTAARQNVDRAMEVMTPFSAVGWVVQHYVEDVMPDLTFPKEGTKIDGSGPAPQTLDPAAFVAAKAWYDAEVKRRADEQERVSKLKKGAAPDA